MEKSVILIMITFTFSSNIQGVINLITCSFYASFHKYTSTAANTDNMYLFHVLLTKATVITCDDYNYDY